MVRQPLVYLLLLLLMLAACTVDDSQIGRVETMEPPTIVAAMTPTPATTETPSQEPTSTSAPTLKATPEETQTTQTPDDTGTCVAFSFEEAQGMAAFPLVAPDEMPDWLLLDAILVRHEGESQDLESCVGGIQADAFFAASLDDGQQIPLILIQTTTEPDYSEFPSEVLDVPGKDVVRYTPDESYDRQPDFYAWQSGETWCALIVPEDAPVDEANLLSLIESME